mgnify:FL=1
MVSSYPKKAETRIKRVDFGRWKFVSKQSAILNSKFSLMNNVVLDHLLIKLISIAADSNALKVVVPIESILPPLLFIVSILFLFL